VTVISPVTENDEQRPSENSDRRRNSKWSFVERIFAVIGAIAALLAIVGGIVAGVHRLPFYQEHREEGMVAKLNPGDSFARMTQLIGADPDFRLAAAPGLEIYVFDRRWEYLQLVVNASGSVLSVGVYAKVTSFRATLANGYSVNGPPVGSQLADPTGISGSCGASWYSFYEGSSTGSEVGDLRHVIFGELPVTDTNVITTGAPCRLLFSNAPCLRRADTYQPGLSWQLLDCLQSLKPWQSVQKEMPSAIVIVTAPDQPIIPAMINDQYFSTLARV
jgi:hypothetical protein